MSRLGFGLGLDVIKPVTAGGGGDGADLKTNLAAWWALDEASGNRVDAHTNGYTLTDNNTVLNTAAKIGANAALFNEAMAEYLSRTNAAEAWRLNTNDMTIGFWVKWTSYGVGSQHILSCGASVGTVQGYRIMTTTTGANIYVIVANGSSAVNHLPAWDSAPSVGTWYYIFVEIDRSDKISMWKNNTIESVQTDVSSFSANDIIAGSDFRLGRGPGADTDYFHGGLDEVAIWNRLLTSLEKTWLWNDGAGRAYNEIG